MAVKIKTKNGTIEVSNDVIATVAYKHKHDNYSSGHGQQESNPRQH